MTRYQSISDVVNESYSIEKYYGYVDQVKLSGLTLLITGWAASKSGELPEFFILSSPSDEVEIWIFDRLERPDVRKRVGINNINCGFRVEIDINKTFVNNDFSVFAVFASNPNRHRLKLSSPVSDAITGIAGSNAIRQSVKSNQLSSGIGATILREIELAGYLIKSQIKIDNIFLAEKNGIDYIIKRHKTDIEIDRYTELYEAWQKEQGRFKRLVLPRFIEKIGAFHVVEYIEGESVPWSEFIGESGYGGEGISVELVNPIIELAQEFSELNVFGDFYWRNFILVGNGKIAAVDWELGNFGNGELVTLLAYIYSLMFNNIEWRYKLLSEIRRLNLVTEKDFKNKLIGFNTLFREQWNDYPKIIDILDRELAIFISKIGFHKLFMGADLYGILEKSRYHFYKELGQLKDHNSQIDCEGKLNKLAVERLPFMNSKILDIGPNSGWFIKEFAALGAKEIIGLELERAWCDLANTILNDFFDLKNCRVIQGNIMDSDIGEFDLITSISMLHYIENKEDFFKKVSNSMAGNGFFLLETPVHEGEDKIVVWDMDPVRYIPSVNYIKYMAESSGLDLIYYGNSNLKDRRVFHFKKNNINF